MRRSGGLRGAATFASLSRAFGSGFLVRLATLRRDDSELDELADLLTLAVTGSDKL